MKKIAAIIVLACIGAAANAQPAVQEGTTPVLSTSIASSAAAITVKDVVINPNPVKGQNFSLELQNLEKGKYSIYIFDKEGKKYLLKTLNIEAGSSTEVIDLPKQATSGTYILQVLSKNARFSKKMIIE